MSQFNTPSDPIKAHQREAAAARRNGVRASCKCGEDRPEALITGSRPITCAACRRTENGKSTFDWHHVAGKAHHCLTIPVPVNDHRAILSVDQYDWPKRTLENPDRSPLIAAAACIRGFISTVIYLVDRLLKWIAEALERIDQMLTERLGPRWWINTEFNSNAETKKKKKQKQKEKQNDSI
jgi:hypothetical protein